MTTSLIESELAASGVAQVIVVLSGPPAAAAAGRRRGIAAAAASAAPNIQAYFRSSELSIDSQIAASGARPAGARLGVAAAARRSIAAPPPPPVRYYPNLNIMLGTVDRAGLAALEADQGVASVSGAPPLSPIWPDRIAAASAPKDLTWGLKALRIDEVWAQNITGAGILVGQLDTGIDGTHPTLLDGAIHKFAEFDLLGTKRTPAPAAHDTDDHGTHTAATIVGRRTGNRHIGVAPGAQLLGAIVIEGGNAIARVLGGIDWALGEGMRVLSLSLGFRGWWEDFVPVMSILRARNVLPVIAVGNEGGGTSRSPGNYPNVLSVGAMDVNGGIPNFSSSRRFARVDRPDVPYLVAPGVDVVSAKPGGGYQAMDGSSMATPHVAGLAALLFQAKPTATALEVEAAIFGSCTLRPGMDAARAGAGCPDAVRALEILTGAPAIVTPPPPPAKKAPKRTTTKKRTRPAKRKSTAKKQAPAKKTAARRSSAATRTGAGRRR